MSLRRGCSYFLDFMVPLVTAIRGSPLASAPAEITAPGPVRGGDHRLRAWGASRCRAPSPGPPSWRASHAGRRLARRPALALTRCRPLPRRLCGRRDDRSSEQCDERAPVQHVSSSALYPCGDSTGSVECSRTANRRVRRFARLTAPSGAAWGRGAPPSHPRPNVRGSRQGVRVASCGLAQGAKGAPRLHLRSQPVRCRRIER
jgi:hypothetical protein